MPDNSYERLEKEALESLVASDLSAKMKQWRTPASAPPRGGRRGFWIGIMLLALGGAAWLFWPAAPRPLGPSSPAHEKSLPPTVLPTENPVAQKETASPNKYLALAQASYQAPDFASETRGSKPGSPDPLNASKTALSQKRYSEALKALQEVPDAYKTDADYLRGHALFGQKKYAQAAAVFGQLSSSVRYGEAAQWFELLSLLPDFAQHKAQLLKKLEGMSNENGHTYQQEARQLLKSI